MRILYLEDNPRDADLVRRALMRAERVPPQIEVAPTLAAARAALDGPVGFDLVLTDLNLPDGNGLDLVADIRRRGLPLAVVALTGQGDEALVLAALKAGADDYLPKSDDFADRVPSALRSALLAFRADRARHSQPLRVLYVEHNAADVDLTRRHMAAHAPYIELESVADAPTALERLAGGAAEQVDVLLLDFRLAGDSGLDLLKTVRLDRGWDLPVVLVTGQGSEEIAAHAMRLGATDYVVKRGGYLVALPAVVESAFHRVQTAREQAALRELNASLERKVAERTTELEAAKEAAEAANRSKSTFLARMSHDLRTPLNAVLGFSQLLALDPALANADRAQRHLQLIHDAGQHLLSMIDEVLDLARIESGGLRLNPVTVDACTLVQECLLLVDVLARQHHVSVRKLPPPGPCLVRADRTRLRQVLVNLLTNGIKYNRSGGEVVVEISGAVADGGVQLRVTDSGRGMSPSQLASLFQPFNRVGAETSGIEGTGLGLVITKQLVEAMQGRLLVSSTPGEGSTFTITLPTAGSDPLAPADPEWSSPPPVQATGRVRRRVLYVEDNAVNRTLMQQMLQLHPGVDLQMAEDGESALRRVAERRPDLLLLDLDLPGISGIELLQRLRADAASAGIPCVAVSAFAHGPEVEQALAGGCVAFLTKPFELARLLDLVEHHAG